MSSIPSPVADAVARETGASLTGFSPASGGCINNGGQVVTSAGHYFLKWNDGTRYPRMFETEAKGLALLAGPSALRVPRVITAGAAASYQFLLMEYVESGRRSLDYWENFGRGLALIHRQSAPAFGLDHDNYIGSLPQRNRQHSSWTEFFINARLEPQLKLALQAKALEASASRKFAQLFSRLPELLPGEPPSLLHGDLWGGNLMTTSSGQPCLIDPAVYYGHREVDLAMTQLFGGFDPVFFHAYDDAFPLLPGYEERLALYNLYPLLVHVNLFGGGYAGQVMSVLNRFL